MTFLFVMVILMSTDKKATPMLAGFAIGFTLLIIHLMTIPVDNTSVNPARSFRAAIFAGSALAQLWAFVVFPIVGAVVGVAVWLAVGSGSLRETRLAGK